MSIAIVAVSLLTTACNAGTPDPAPQTPSGSAPTAASSSPTDAGQQSQSGSPTAPAATLSRADWLRGLWSGKGEPPAPLPVIREADPADYLNAVGTCMDNAGWINESKVPGETSFTVPKGQEQSFAEAQYQCYAQYPLAPKYYQPYNDAQLKALYDYQTGPLLDCLRGQGITPDATPSFEKFSSDYRGQVSPRWHPYNAIPDRQARSIDKLCPLEPEGFFDLATTPG